MVTDAEVQDVVFSMISLSVALACPFLTMPSLFLVKWDIRAIRAQSLRGDFEL